MYQKNQSASKHTYRQVYNNINTKTTKQVVYSRQLLNQVCVLYSVTSMMSGQVYSEWRIPSEWEGEDLKVMLHFSGLCAPGPGFLVVSVVGSVRVCGWQIEECTAHIVFLPIIVILPHTTVALECTTTRTAFKKMLVGCYVASSHTAVQSLQVREGLVQWGPGTEALFMFYEVCLYKANLM